MLIVVQIEMYLDHSDTEKNLDALVLITCGILAVWKVTLFRIRSSGLVSNFTSAVRDYNELVGEEKRAIMRRHAYMGRVACASLIGVSYSAATLFTSVPMFTGNDETGTEDNRTKKESVDYPIPSELTMEVLQVPEYFYSLIFIVEYGMLLVTSNGNLGKDSRNIVHSVQNG